MALQQVKDSDKFIKRLHLFRVEDFNDLLPLVANKASAERDEVSEKIDEVFEVEDFLSLSAAGSN